MTLRLAKGCRYRRESGYMEHDVVGIIRSFRTENADGSVTHIRTPTSLP